MYDMYARPRRPLNNCDGRFIDLDMLPNFRSNLFEPTIES
jgi:hypothetical protein